MGINGPSVWSEPPLQYELMPLSKQPKCLLSVCYIFAFAISYFGSIIKVNCGVHFKRGIC